MRVDRYGRVRRALERSEAGKLCPGERLRARADLEVLEYFAGNVTGETGMAVVLSPYCEAVLGLAGKGA